MKQVQYTQDIFLLSCSLSLSEVQHVVNAKHNTAATKGRKDRYQKMTDCSTYPTAPIIRAWVDLNIITFVYSIKVMLMYYYDNLYDSFSLMFFSCNPSGVKWTRTQLKKMNLKTFKVVRRLSYVLGFSASVSLCCSMITVYRNTMHSEMTQVISITHSIHKSTPGKVMSGNAYNPETQG